MVISISVNMEIKDELVEIPVATTKFFKTYWELAIKECEIKLFREGACFGKEQLHEIVRELEHLSNWVENHLLGSEYDYMHKSEGDECKWIERKMNLMIDAPFWVGEKCKWEEAMKHSNDIIVMDDKMLAYELVNLRYHNCISVHKVEFFEKYLCITLDDEKILSIAYESDSDYSWILEEYGDKKMQDKMMVFCQGNEIYAKNIPEMI